MKNIPGVALVEQSVSQRSKLFAYGLAVSLIGAMPLAGQDAGSPSGGSRRIAVGHWAYEAVRELRSAGYFQGINPIVQPYRRIDLARGLRDLPTDLPGGRVAHWVKLLREELRPEIERLDGGVGQTWGMNFQGAARASTSHRLDPLRPTGGGGIWPFYRLGAWVEKEWFVTESGLMADLHLADDPDGLNPGQRRLGRPDHAYVALDWSFGSVSLGRMERNWALGGTKGLMVSDISSSYPQLGIEIRAGSFVLRSFSGELDTSGGRKKYLSAHRVDFESPDLVVSLGESVVYAPENSGFSLRYLNPVHGVFFEIENEPTDVIANLMLNPQLWLQLNSWTIFADFLLDDFDWNPGTSGREATLYAVNLRLTRSDPGSSLRAGAEFRRVSAWAYRTPNIVDEYSFLGRGLGENFSDFDRFTVFADFWPNVGGLRLTPQVIVQRQGEGDFRDPITDMTAYLASPGMFLGTVETTLRASLAGRYQPSRHFWVSWDFGRNWVRNADHVDGQRRSSWEGVMEIGVSATIPKN